MRISEKIKTETDNFTTNDYKQNLPRIKKKDLKKYASHDQTTVKHVRVKTAQTRKIQK